jgi:hypothetical protein
LKSKTPKKLDSFATGFAFQGFWLASMCNKSKGINSGSGVWTDRSSRAMIERSASNDAKVNDENVIVSIIWQGFWGSLFVYSWFKRMSNRRFGSTTA